MMNTSINGRHRGRKEDCQYSLQHQSTSVGVVNLVKTLQVVVLLVCVSASREGNLEFGNMTPHEGVRDRVCIVGSGNWGSAIAKLVGNNCDRLDAFESPVNMWVYEETIETKTGPQKLSSIINSKHENVKYLPGIKLPPNVIACPDLEKACKGATLLIFVLPHQFLPKLLPVIRRHAAPSCRGVSLIKGLGTI